MCAFATRAGEITALFRDGFERIADEEITPGQLIPVFARHERWMVWRCCNRTGEPAGTPILAS
jgi:hypothetical protein